MFAKRGVRKGAFAEATLPPIEPDSSLSGAVYTVGNGDCGQLGLGEEEDDAESIVAIKELSKGIVRMSAAPLHNAAITVDGKVWTWGCNDDCALGRTGPERSPALITALPADAKVIQVSSGDCHTAMLTSDGRVFACGTYKNSNGYIGFRPGQEKEPVPALVPGLPSHKLKGKRAVQIASGVNHTAALLEDGTVHVWGDGEQGQLGRVVRARHKENALCARDPVVFPRAPGAKGRGKAGVPRIVRIFCGEYHCLALDSEHNVYAWGLNNFGQLGVGDHESSPTPRLVAGLSGKRVVRLAGGEHFSLALTADNVVYGFGRADYGQLGLGVARNKEQAENTPVEIEALYDKGIIDIACGGSFSLAVSASGTLYTFGFGDCYQLGNDDSKDEVLPFAVNLKNVIEANGGAQHSIILVKK